MNIEEIFELLKLGNIIIIVNNSRLSISQSLHDNSNTMYYHGSMCSIACTPTLENFIKIIDHYNLNLLDFRLDNKALRKRRNSRSKRSWNAPFLLPSYINLTV